MANAVSGVGSIDVATLVSQLMTAEGGQQTQLSKQKTKEQSALTALQSTNTNFLAIKTAAETIIGSVLAPKSWSVQSASSSSTTVAATATSAAIPGTYSLDVTSVAATHKLLYGGAVSASASVGGGSLSFTQGATTTPVNLSGATTLSQVVLAINNTADLGVKASAIQVGTDSFRLQLTSTSSGAAGQFSVTGLAPALGSSALVSTGTDAVVKFGPADTDVASSSTNTFSTLFPGLSFTVSKPETGVNLTVAQDATAMSAQVKTLVDSVNAALKTIKAAGAYNSTTKTGGALVGELLPRSLSAALTGTLFASSGSSLASFGVQLTRDGVLTFDATKFQSAVAANPASATSAISGLATRLGTLAKTTTDSGTGTLTQSITNRTNRVASLTARITDWDSRLAVKKAQLTKTYSALNTKLGTLSDQASWLTSQIAQLPTASALS